MRKGFSIIELVVGMSVSALLAISLFQLLSSTRRTVARISRVISVDQSLMIFIAQFSKDVTGMFAPRSSIEFFALQDEKGGAEKKPSERAIKDVFKLEQRAEGFVISFITTGGIQFVDPQKGVKETSAVKRVSYSYERDPARPGTYRLMYQIGDAQEASLAGARSYELCNNIKRLDVELTMIEQSTEAGKESSRTVPITEWNEATVWKQYKSLIPAFMRFKGALVDLKERPYPFDCLEKVYAYSPYVQKEKSLFEALEDIATSLFGK